MLNTRVSIGFTVVRDSEVAEDLPNVTVVSLQKLKVHALRNYIDKKST